MKSLALPESLRSPNKAAIATPFSEDARATKYLLQTFHEFASAAAKWCPWSKAFYEMWKAKGMKRHAILRKLAYKWIRILFRCWKTPPSTIHNATKQSSKPRLQRSFSTSRKPSKNHPKRLTRTQKSPWFNLLFALMPTDELSCAAKLSCGLCYVLAARKRWRYRSGRFSLASLCPMCHPTFAPALAAQTPTSAIDTGDPNMMIAVNRLRFNAISEAESEPTVPRFSAKAIHACLWRR